MPRSWCLLLAAATFGAPHPARADGPPTVEEERAAIRPADPSLAIELVAAEPTVVSPVALAWDEFGRLYVAEMSDYPNAPTGGRIKRLEDRDGDGRYEHATVFADKLSYPNGVLPWNGGVLVTAAPDLLFFKDTDGDGRADVRRVILTGFGEGNQQLRVNSPTWGMDNWVYLANGRSGGSIRRPGDPPGSAVAIPRNDLRVRPSTGEFEPVAGFSQFGLPRDDWGDRFPSWNTVPLRHVVLEARPSTTHASAGAGSVAEILDPADGGRIYSLAPAQTRFNAEKVTYFNATCGPTIYRGDLLGDAYRGHAFVCEPLTSVVHHRRLDPVGPTYSARRVEAGREFLASSHPWFRPVNLANGPDGALYLADFCRAWVEHPAFVPANLRNSVDFREGHDRGRVWRVAPRGASNPSKSCRPGQADTAALVAMLAHANGWCRDTAQRLLVERNDAAAVEPLRTLAKSSPVPIARAHALWTLDGLKALNPESVRVALRDGDPRVREQAVRLASPSAADYEETLSTLAEDTDARVRLRVAVALAPLDSDRARVALARLVTRDAGSPWTATAVLGGIAQGPLKWLSTLEAHEPAWLADPSPAQARFLASLARLVRDQTETAAVVDRAAEARSDAAAFSLLAGVAKGQSHSKTRPLPTSGPESGPVNRVLAAAGAAARNPDRPPWVRVVALDLLLDTRPADARGLLAPLLEPDQPSELQSASARGVAAAADPALLDTLFQNWDRYAIGTRRVLLGSLSGTPAHAGRLLDAVEKGQVPAAEIDPATRESLRRLADPKLRERVDAVLRAAPESDRREVVRRYESATRLPADPARGRSLFVKNCQTCHAHGGQGAKVGPDLLSVVGRPKDDLLVAILDPTREAAPDGLGVVVVTTRGLTLTGLLAEETPAAVRLRRAEGVEDVIPRNEVEAVRPTGRSLMPDGLEQVLSPQDVADLIAFLRSPEPSPKAEK